MKTHTQPHTLTLTHTQTRAVTM